MSANYCGAIAHVFVVFAMTIDKNNIWVFFIRENYFFQIYEDSFVVIFFGKIFRENYFFSKWEDTFVAIFSLEKYFAKIIFFSSHFTCDPADRLTRSLGEGPAGAAHKVRPEAVAHQVEVGRLHAGRLAQPGQAEAKKRADVDGVESGLVFFVGRSQNKVLQSFKNVVKFCEVAIQNFVFREVRSLKSLWELQFCWNIVNYRDSVCFCVFFK